MAEGLSLAVIKFVVFLCNTKIVVEAYAYLDSNNCKVQLPKSKRLKCRCVRSIVTKSYKSPYLFLNSRESNRELQLPTKTTKS